ncbi:hypothetical protein LTR92_001091 [Exophiala xenobiotica]|nr:hypothetical protein LTR92_001091 [Exophiala xenobiotica]
MANIIIFFLVLLWVSTHSDPIVEFLEMGMAAEARVSDLLWEWVDLHPEDFYDMMWYAHFAASVLFLWFSLSALAKAYANSDRMLACVMDTYTSCYQALFVTMPRVTRNALEGGSRLLSDWLSSTLCNLLPTTPPVPEIGFVPGAFPTKVHELWQSGHEGIAVDGMGESEAVDEVVTVDTGVQTEDLAEEPAMDNRQALADENASLQTQNADLKASLDDLRAALATERASRAEARISTQRRRALEAERDSFRTELQALKGGKGSVESNSAGLRVECDTLRGQNAELKEELEELKAARDSAESQPAINTQQELEAIRQELRQEQADRQAVQVALDATTVTLNQCNERRVWLEGQCQGLDLEVQRLNGENDQLRAANTNANHTACNQAQQEALARCEALESDCRTVRLQKDCLKQQIEAGERHVQQLRREGNQLHHEHGLTLQKREQDQKLIQQLQEKVDRYEQREEDFEDAEKLKADYKKVLRVRNTQQAQLEGLWAKVGQQDDDARTYQRLAEDQIAKLRAQLAAQGQNATSQAPNAPNTPQNPRPSSISSENTRLGHSPLFHSSNGKGNNNNLGLVKVIGDLTRDKKELAEQLESLEGYAEHLQAQVEQLQSDKDELEVEVELYRVGNEVDAEEQQQEIEWLKTQRDTEVSAARGQAETMKMIVDVTKSQLQTQSHAGPRLSEESPRKNKRVASEGLEAAAAQRVKRGCE